MNIAIIGAGNVGRALATSFTRAARRRSGLGRAQQLEQIAFLNIALNATNGWSWQSGWKLAGAPAAFPNAA